MRPSGCAAGEPVGSPFQARDASEILDARQVCGHVGAGPHATLAYDPTVVTVCAGIQRIAGGTDVGIHIGGRDLGVLLTVVSSPTCRESDVVAVGRNRIAEATGRTAMVSSCRRFQMKSSSPTGSYFAL